MIENTQRDLNIALMNELALICDRLGIRTQRRAGGGGHQVELPAASRPAWSAATASASTPTTSPPRPRASATIPRSSWPAGGSTTAWARFVAQKLVKLLIAQRGPGAPGAGGRAGADLQGERARPAQQPGARHPARAGELRHRRHDPRPAGATPAEAQPSTGWRWRPLERLRELDALVLAVPHRAYLRARRAAWRRCWDRAGILSRRPVGRWTRAPAARGHHLLEPVSR